MVGDQRITKTVLELAGVGGWGVGGNGWAREVVVGDGTWLDEDTAPWKWHLQYRESLTVSTPASSSSVTFPTMDWTDTFSRKRKWVK